MTRYSFICLLITSLVCEATVSAQTILNNYYNAPPSYTPGGLPGQSFPNFQSQPQYFGSNPGATTTSAPINYTTGAPTTTTTTGYPTTATTYPTTTTTYPTTTTSYIPTTTTTSGNVVQQIYPQPAQPTANLTTGTPTTVSPQTAATQVAPLQIQQLPLQYVAPPDALLPGLFTIKNSKWTLTDYFDNLSQYIGVKVEVVKPEGKYIPLSDRLLESRVKGILQEANITTDALDIPCQPPTPMFYVLVMAYPCDRRCIGFITMQLIEIVTPQRMGDIEINGIWQAITWEKTALIASSCEDFAQEVGETIDQFTRSFADSYTYYHPVEEQPCFDVGDNDP